ncbi:anti-sigma factor [Urechidicola croceus]|uniref:Anti-sigma factor n=1 Tax=Urechidicola croceus TaxID=1850246 RepID=A0A1D8P5H8_9FLAO|nr:anti-sigma factor [Urechidicola croceus]AOW19825.1 anti-sigma factor [Urechidicola croceus]
MTKKEYIESGVLELYIAGALSEKESQEVYEMMQKHPEILQEVLDIETSIVKLTAAVVPNNSKYTFEHLKSKLNLSDNKEVKVIDINKPKSNWFRYTGWAASIFLTAGLLWFINENSKLKSQVEIAQDNKQLLEQQIEEAKGNLEETEKLVAIFRDRDIVEIPLGGQAISPESYAKVYWDKKTKSIYLDAQGLPEPPKGKVYQVWSLKLDPLTPTSLGTIDDFISDDNKIFNIANINDSEAFGITLEPAGGSESPTLEQLYTLGAVSTS